MKIKETITFVSEEEKLILPLQYNHMVQGMIYNLLNDNLSSFLHDEGFLKGNRSFKMFTFSRLNGNYTLDKNNSKIIFQGPVSLTIASPFEEFCNSIGNNFLTKEKAQLGNNYIKIKEVTLEKEVVTKKHIEFHTLSPIVIYSTLFKANGKKFTCYFQPGESEFNKLLEKNLRKKYEAFYKQSPPDGDIVIKSLNRPKLSVMNYKQTVIKGYTGKFSMTGPIPLLQMGLDTGLGSKNSQGFGCIKIINEYGR